MGGVLALVVAALVGTGSAHAGSLADAEAALGAAPLDPKARLAFAEALASTPGREEEGVEALWWLLGTAEGEIARDVLGEMIRATPARPGWAHVYVALAAAPEGLAREAARVRSAELRARDPKLRAKAMAELAKIADPLAGVALGDLYLDAGEPEGLRRRGPHDPLGAGTPHWNAFSKTHPECGGGPTVDRCLFARPLRQDPTQ
ncbi:MAG: hypothetical protein ACK4YP_05165 [Myxococcota bacterium]